VTDGTEEVGCVYTTEGVMGRMDGDSLFWDFLREIAVQVDRFQSWAMPIKAVAVREDLWPELTTVHGHPVVRLAESSEAMWGVLA
jgi:hypothetical protein